MPIEPTRPRSPDPVRPASSSRLAADDLAGLIGRTTLHPPINATLAGAIRSMVADGRIPVGGRLPAERELAAALGVSRVTVTSSYRVLRESGWAEARQGAGTWTRVPDRSGVVAAFVPGRPRDGSIDLTFAAPAGPPEVADAYAAALTALPHLLPGHGYVAAGLDDLRARIADRFTARGLTTSPEEVLVTLGTGGAVTSALRALVSPGDRVLVEHPVWPNVLDVLAMQQVRPVPVPRDPGSPEGAAGFVAAMHRAARQTSARAAYVVPDFANPTGHSLTADDRLRLVASLQQQDVTIVADEALVDLALDGQDALPPLAASARPGAVVTVGGLSKSVWAGLRIGWMRAEPALLSRVSSTMSREFGSLSTLDQLAACTLLDGLDAGLVERREQLRTQRDALVAGLRRHLPTWEVPVPAGGLSLWCRLPAGASSSAIADAAEPLGLHLATGSRFGTGHAFDDHLRLPFTQPVDVLADAVQRLVRAADAADRAWGSPTSPRTGALLG